MDRKAVLGCMIMMLLTGGSLFAAVDKDELRALLRPMWEVHANEFAADRAKWQQQRIRELAAVSRLPEELEKRESAIALDALYHELFFEFIKSGSVPRETLKLTEYGGDIAFPSVDRARAYMLVYLATDEPSVMASAMMLSPNGISVFSRIKDSRFRDVLAVMLLSAAKEEAETWAMNRSAIGPYTEALVRRYGEWVTAAYFQNISPAAMEYLWERGGHFLLARRVLGYETAAGIFASLDRISPDGAPQLIGYLLKHAMDRDIADIIKLYPARAVMIRETVSKYRLATKTRLDDTIDLMRRAATVPAGGDAATTQPQPR